MAYKNTEIELKFSLPNPEDVINFLNINAKKIFDSTVQTDTYYTPAHKNFLDADYPYQWLRIRESDKGLFLNYKHFYPENKEENDYCDEFEILVDDPVIKEIFLRLDFKKIIEVRKERTSWAYKNVEISIDTIKELGTFIEFEITTYFDNPKEAKKYLHKLTREIGLNAGPAIHKGYPLILLEKHNL